MKEERRRWDSVSDHFRAIHPQHSESLLPSPQRYAGLFRRSVEAWTIYALYRDRDQDGLDSVVRRNYGSGHAIQDVRNAHASSNGRRSSRPPSTRRAPHTHLVAEPVPLLLEYVPRQG